MSELFQIPEIVAQIINFLDKPNTQTVSSVNKLFNATAEYQLSHSLLSTWDRTAKEFEKIKSQFTDLGPTYRNGDIRYVDHRTGYIFFIFTNNFEKFVDLSVTHFFNNQGHFRIRSFNDSLHPIIVTLPAYLSKSHKPELYAILDHGDEKLGSHYINLYHLDNFQIIHSTKSIGGKPSLQLIRRFNIFRHWSPH